MDLFQAPKLEDLKGFSNEELDAKIAEAEAAFAPYAEIADSDLNDDQATDMFNIAEFFTAAGEEKAAREQADADRAERLSAARQSMARRPEDEEEEEEEEGDPRGEVIPGEEEDPEEEEEEEKRKRSSDETETASSKRSSLSSRAAKNAPKRKRAPAPPKREGATLTVAADVPGYSAGQKFETLTEAGGAIMKRLRAMPTSPNGRQFTRNGAIAVNLPDNKLSQKNYQGRDSELLLAASNESRLEGGSLVAAGGWGAPSDTVLDFCKMESTDGLINLPEVTITRGGVNYTKGPSFADVRASATGFWDMDEATAEAGTEQKTSLRPEVPDFTDQRLDAVGLMVEAGLLLRSAWPEVIDRYTELALVAHQFKMAAKSIRQIEAFTGAAISVPNGFGNALDVLHVLEVVAVGERQRYAMPKNMTLEVLLPAWVQAVIRADLANRNGVDNYLNISDAQINAYFSARNLRVQWLSEYQNIDVDTAGVATAYPATVESIMYPAGTYVRGVSDVISLDTVYDSTNLKKNDFVNLFVEQGTVVTNPCNEGRRISLPLNANGRTGAADISGNLFRAAV